MTEIQIIISIILPLAFPIFTNEMILIILLVAFAVCINEIIK